MSRARDLYDRLVAGGEPEVLSFIDQRITEELFLEYKQSADSGQGRTLHDNDRKNLAKAISGFGNSEGGVIIWGVKCRNDPVKGDVPEKAVPLADSVKFKSLLEQATTGLTVPPPYARSTSHYSERICCIFDPGGATPAISDGS
jgi:Putative DNA-binding domain